LDGTGKEWTSPTTIAEDHPKQLAGGTTHYTDFIELEPCRLLVVYDNVPYGWYEIPFADRKSKNIIYGTFVEVHKNYGNSGVFRSSGREGCRRCCRVEVRRNRDRSRQPSKHKQYLALLANCKRSRLTVLTSESNLFLDLERIQVCRE
jgi:hypothetical protein